MSKRKHRNIGDSESHWQTSSDLLTALVLILLLIILLLGLYVLNLHDEIREGIYPQYDTEEKDGTGYNEGRDDDDGHGNTWEDEDNSGGGGSDHTQDYPYIQPGGGGGRPEDEGIKTAIFVKLIDGDTNETIKEQGVTFELYGEDGFMEILNTYYPEKIAYRDYETREDGTFYLPEKIYEGAYYFHQISDIEGYDRAPDTYFDVEEMYDWPEPFVVEIVVNPAMNNLYLHLQDSNTGLPIENGEFRIVAMEDIITNDGVTRLKAGEVAAVVTTDENGDAVTPELYLGHYRIEQHSVPEYYASVLNPIETEVQKKTKAVPYVNTIKETRSAVTIRLTDEMDGSPIRNVDFEVDDGSSSTVYTTNAEGEIILDTLDKLKTYTVEQKETSENYRNTENTLFTVSEDGRIDGEEEQTYVLTNRMIRVSIGATDQWFGRNVAELPLSLYKGNGTLVQTWQTGSSDTVFETLEPGQYYLVANNDETTKTMFTVKDTADMQHANITVKTTIGTIILIGGGVVGIGILTLIAMLIRKHIKKKKG